MAQSSTSLNLDDIRLRRLTSEAAAPGEPIRGAFVRWWLI
jgi:hypothetical protein